MMKRLLALLIAFTAVPAFAQGDFVVNYRGLVAGRPLLTNGFVTFYRAEHGFYVAIEASPSASESWTLRLPTSNGGLDQCLKTDGNGVTRWETCVPSDAGITELTGDVTAGPGNGSQAATIGVNKVQNTMLAQMLTGRVKCRQAGSTGDPEDCTAAQMRTLMSVVPGTDVQAYSAKLAAIDALTWAADKAPYFTSASAASTFDLSSAMRTYFTTPSSANLRAVITDETGSGVAVFDDTPTLKQVTINSNGGSSVAAIFDNLTSTGDITQWKDNGTIVGRVADGGYLRLGDGACGTTPTYSFNSDTDTGFWWRTGGSIEICSNGSHTASFNNGGNLVMGSARQMGWSNIAAATNAPDTSLARHSGGVIRVAAGGSEIRGFLGGGAAVASATALPLPTGRVFHVTGTTTITSITSTNFGSGAVITLIFDGVLTFTDGSNLVLAGNFVTTADDSITLVYDGTNWYETSRSVN
jgi:hypothetical protein